MPLKNEINKLLIIGSGPNIVGEIAEFDLITQQAIDSFLEDGVKLVVVNPNPATVATDPRDNVTVYLEPMTLDFLKRILRMELPDAIVTALGSSISLEMGLKLKQSGILDELGIKLLTINDQTLEVSNDKRKLIDILAANNLPCSKTFDLDTGIESMKQQLQDIHFPIIVLKTDQFGVHRHFNVVDENELLAFLERESRGADYNPQNYQFYEDLSDWEEVLVDVLRDNVGNLNFVNFAGAIEPVAVNSGDSILVSPILTLNNQSIQRIRVITKKIGQIFNHHGILSVHFAVRQQNDRVIIKVLSIRPRITRSALLAYRAGTYNIGYVLAKIALGYNLNEITDPNSGLNAAIEPILDTVATKFPNWSFTESGENHYNLSDRMQARGEAVGIGRNFETAVMKGLESTNPFGQNTSLYHKYLNEDVDELLEELAQPTETRLIQLVIALMRGVSLTKLRQILKIHPVYLQKLNNIAQTIKELQTTYFSAANESENFELLKRAKRFGFSDTVISLLMHQDISVIQEKLAAAQIKPSYLQLDGTAGMYTPKVSAVYSAYGVANEVEPTKSEKRKILIIGLGPFQISLNSEFDFMLFHAIRTLNELNYETIIISNNSEAISSSYRLVDRVYFEPITVENILKIAEYEGVEAVMTQFSGKQTNQFVGELQDKGLKVIGQENFDLYHLDHKEVLNELLENLDFNGVPGTSTKTLAEALTYSDEIGYPVLVGGKTQNRAQKSAVVFDAPALKEYVLENELDVINISKFIDGQKYEVTAISDGENVTIPGIIEHLEQSGSHASDSIAVFNPQNLTSDQRRQIRDMTVSLSHEIKMRGFLNIHFLIFQGTIYVLQIKTYAGHNVAFLSKALRQNITEVATKVILGSSLQELGLPADIWPSNKLIHVKMPVFSYINYQGENSFDSKMKASGSVVGRDTALSKALYKGYAGAGLTIPTYGSIFISVKDDDKKEATDLARRFHLLGFKIFATEGTAGILAEAGITVNTVPKVQGGNHNVIDKLTAHKINLVINVTNYSDLANQDATQIKDAALHAHIPVFSSLKTASYVLEVLESLALTTQPI